MVSHINHQGCEQPQQCVAHRFEQLPIQQTPSALPGFSASFCAGTPQPKWVVPRATSALPVVNGEGQMLSGISAYAFQGTNAHALVARAPVGQPSSADGIAYVHTNTARATATVWQREAYWVGPPVHIMMHRCRVLGAGSARKASLAMECQLSATPRLAYFWDHRVGGRVLFPGAGFFEVATAGAKAAAGKGGAAAVALDGASIPAPLQLAEQSQMQKQAPVVLRITARLASGALVVTSSPGGHKQQHLTANATCVVNMLPADVGAAELQQRQQLSAQAASLLLDSLRRASSPAAQMAPAHAIIDNSACDGTSHFHPASLDSCLQLAAASASSALKVPAALGCLYVPDRLSPAQLAASSWQRGAASGATDPSVVDYWLAEPTSCFGLGVSSLELKPLGRLPTPGTAAAAAVQPAAATAAAASEQLLYEVSWPAAEPCSLPSPAAAAAADDGSSKRSAVQLLPCAGISTAAGAIAALQALQLESLGGAQMTTKGALHAVANTATGAGSSTCSSSSAGVAEGGLPGLMRTLALEYQGQRFASLDVDALAPGVPATSGAQLALLPPGTAPERGVDAYGAAHRSGVQQRASLLPAKTRSSIPAFHLMPRPRGALSSLKPEPVPTASVAQGQVLMAVKAVGVNFR